MLGLKLNHVSKSGHWKRVYTEPALEGLIPCNWNTQRVSVAFWMVSFVAVYHISLSGYVIFQVMSFLFISIDKPVVILPVQIADVPLCN